ncbi:tail fiber domain-containing protein [Catalinimonas niigatensis]|uniref:tail fiber domain-containing protein n=1 Tax=Catalinimonas niigatensis TaxID=1397264 RepID=UPI002666461B|nr:tail fiber domain-containing protein [Catalinimonas niigatensis]WPP49608.1 tail fiber domain-containing protein [Catalinimonas niigatensis]
MKYKGSSCFAICILIFLIGNQQAWSQNNVGIGTNEPNSNAVLQIVAPTGDQGLLIPTLTTDEREATAFTSRLGTAENGLMVFDTDLNTFFFWINDQWQPIVSGRASQFLLAGEGIEITEDSIISNIGDTDSTNDITNATLAEGDLSGTFPELTIVPSAVTTEKIADASVNSVKIANNTILPQDLQSPGAGKVLITTSGGTVFWENQSLFGITFLQEGHIYIGNSSNQPSALEIRGDGRILIGNSTSANAVNVSGDISLNSTGNAQINENAVGSTELQNLSVTTNKLADASITSAKLGNNAVESTKIIDGAVTTAKLANDAVDATKIADGVIENIHVSATAAIDGSKINPNFGTQKASSAITEATDAPNTLTTKGYVDGLEVGINRITPLAAANIIVGNGTANQAVSISGDATMDATGELTLTSNAAATLGLGSLAFQDAGAVNITGGTVEADLNADNIVSGTLDEAHLPTISGIEGTYGGSGQYIESVTVDVRGRVTSISANIPPSDRRLKENIQPLDNSLDKVLQLSPAQYQWIDPEKEGTSYGLIAQELAEVYPALVKKRSDGYFGVNYIELIPVLIKAVQEQQLQIEELKSERAQIPQPLSDTEVELQNLKTENNQLRQEIEVIKKALGLTEKASLND